MKTETKITQNTKLTENIENIQQTFKDELYNTVNSEPVTGPPKFNSHRVQVSEATKSSPT